MFEITFQNERKPCMSILDLFLIAVSLSMDALAVSVCKSLAIRRAGVREACTMGIWFGGFQFLMPVLGWILGSRFINLIRNIDHWIAFILLSFIGGNMIREADHTRRTGETEDHDDRTDPKTMFLLAVATSIDALAVGVTFAFLEIAVLPASAFIGCVTFTICFFAVLGGSRLGGRFGNNAKYIGGAVLIFIGLRILVTDLFL